MRMFVETATGLPGIAFTAALAVAVRSGSSAAFRGMASNRAVGTPAAHPHHVLACPGAQRAAGRLEST
ncbi:hypothetical protein [Streptomyces sp. NBC_01428]|uniref:hypothetical protein n=1 Tax=Streptomyces sp. NBC_01428 TaxID=2903861 RepID=UPI002E32DC1D|nr:hypothetical protein [Streptomyces sp. NBC_01428]